MPSPTTATPRGTRAVVSALMAALDAVPETHRKAALKHAVAIVRERLGEQSRNAKLASRRAPALPGAKRKAAVETTRKTRAAQALRSAG
jgi:hypothetical protein